MLCSTLSALLLPTPLRLPSDPIVTDEPSQVLEETPEKSAKEKRKRKKEKERDGSRAEEGPVTTASRTPTGGTTQPITGDKEPGSAYH